MTEFQTGKNLSFNIQLFIYSSLFFNRLKEISQWQLTFKIHENRLTEEINLLNEEKSDTEKELEMLDNPFEIVNRCINKRNNRRDKELTYDDGDIELQKEYDLLNKIKKIFIDQ